MYPEIEPYQRGMLDVGDGNLVYWEVSGNPEGKPALGVHGGPGQGCSPRMRRYFNPDVYRIVLFDQRNCGRSRPLASDPATDLSTTDTEHLLSDMEQLRRHLGIDRLLLFGGSWGCALSLVYALRYPERVSEIVQSALATGRRAETDLLTRGVGAILPQPWARFRDAVPEADRDGDLSDAYYRLLHDPDPAVRAKAARDWCTWEDAMMPYLPPWEAFDDPEFAYGWARLVTHFWRAGSWLEEGYVLREAHRLAGIPTVFVQGEMDLGNLIGTPWLLADAVPGSELVMIPAAGHTASSGGTAVALVAALDRFGEKS